jgi:hypothetical protein
MLFPQMLVGMIINQQKEFTKTVFSSHVFLRFSYFSINGENMKKTITSSIIALLLLSACADNDNGNFYSIKVAGENLNELQCVHIAQIGPEVNTNQTCDN